MWSGCIQYVALLPLVPKGTVSSARSKSRSSPFSRLLDIRAADDWPVTLAALDADVPLASKAERSVSRASINWSSK